MSIDDPSGKVNDKPLLQINGVDREKCLSEIWRHLKGDDEVFVWGNQLSFVAGQKVMPMTNHNVAAWIERRMIPAKVDHEKGAFTPLPCPLDLAIKVADRPIPEWPRVDRVAKVPYFDRGGRVVVRPGRTGSVWLAPSYSGVEIPERPGIAEVEEAKQLIVDDLLGDFPFETQSDRTHMVGALLLPFCLDLINGYAPITYMDSPRPKSGKTKLASIIQLLAGEEPMSTQLCGRKEQDAVAIGGTVQSGATVILLDNVRTLRSELLEAVTGGSGLLVRLPYSRAPDTIRLTEQMMIITGNGIASTVDLAARLNRVRLTPKTPNPQSRTGFRHPDLIGWVMENRPRLASSLLTMVAWWVANGRPESQATKGGFERWSAVIGGILDSIGMRDFLVADEALAEVDDDASDESAFIQSWWGWQQNRQSDLASATQLLEHVIEASEEPVMAGVIGSGTDWERSLRLGRWVRKHREAMFELDDGRMVTIEREFGARVKCYRYRLRITG